jgi:hypothetical protein
VTKQEQACNPNTPPATPVELAADVDVGVRRGIARNPNTPPATLMELATDKNVDVRYWVARNLNTPPMVILWLQSDYRESMILEEFLEATK